MRRTWLGMRGVPRGTSAWIAMAVAICGWRCVVDNRTPTDVVAAEMPSGTDTARSSNVPNSGAAGSGSGNQPGGTAGSSTPGASGMGSGGTDSGTAGPGAAGASTAGAGAAGVGAAGAGTAGAGTAGSTANGGAGSGMTGNSAGSASTTPPPGAGGAPPTLSGSTCPGFDACGGALDGTWTYTNVCIGASENSADVLLQVCPDSSVSYEPGSGATLTFTGGSVSRAGAPVGDSVINFSADCTAGLGCSLVAAPGANCTETAGNCLCRTASSVDWGTQSYTTNGGSLTLGNGRSFDYCVQGDTLTYRETGDAQEFGTNTLQRN